MLWSVGCYRNEWKIVCMPFDFLSCFFFLSLFSLSFCDSFIKASSEINRFTFAVSIVVVSAMEVNVHYKQHPVSQQTHTQHTILLDNRCFRLLKRHASIGVRVSVRCGNERFIIDFDGGLKWYKVHFLNSKIITCSLFYSLFYYYVSISGSVHSKLSISLQKSNEMTFKMNLTSRSADKA